MSTSLAPERQRSDHDPTHMWHLVYEDDLDTALCGKRLAGETFGDASEAECVVCLAIDAAYEAAK